jgi:hypothetical protein
MHGSGEDQLRPQPWQAGLVRVRTRGVTRERRRRAPLALGTAERAARTGRAPSARGCRSCNCNYSTMLPWVDRIFGTHYLPKTWPGKNHKTSVLLLGRIEAGRPDRKIVSAPAGDGKRHPPVKSLLSRSERLSRAIFLSIFLDRIRKILYVFLLMESLPAPAPAGAGRGESAAV